MIFILKSKQAAFISGAAILTAFTAVPNTAFAQSGGQYNGAYVNLGAAILSVDANLDGIDTGAGTIDLGDESVNTFAINGRLGYRFNKYIAAEVEGGFGLGGDDINRSVPVAVAGLGTISVDAEAEVEIDTYGAGFIRGIFPVTDKFDIFARGGYGVAGADASVNATTALLGGLSVSDTISDTIDGFVFGGGAEYHFTKKHGLRADVSAFSGDADVLFFAASYSYKF